jgi:hypothetical protein
LRIIEFKRRHLNFYFMNFVRQTVP